MVNNDSLKDNQPKNISEPNSWQSDLRDQISVFEKSFAERKAALLSKLDNLPSQEARKNLVDSFLNEMDRKSCEVLQS